MGEIPKAVVLAQLLVQVHREGLCVDGLQTQAGLGVRVSGRVKVRLKVRLQS